MKDHGNNERTYNVEDTEKTAFINFRCISLGSTFVGIVGLPTVQVQVELSNFSKLFSSGPGWLGKGGDRKIVFRQNLRGFLHAIIRQLLI